MKKAKANQMAKIWNELHGGSYEPTMTRAEVTEHGKEYDVEVHNVGEKNDGFAFHHIEALADVTRAFGAKSYITHHDGKTYAVIF